MSMNTYLADGVQQALDIMLWSLGDFTDADLFVRPTPAANHAAWQLGHLIVSTASFVSLCSPDHQSSLPAGFADKYKKDRAKGDDPAQFDSKEILITELRNAIAPLVEFGRRATPEQLATPTPESMHSYAKTLGHLLVLTVGHMSMHNGQFQVIRRKLGKPVLM